MTLLVLWCDGHSTSISRSVHQIVQTAKIAPKLLAKWHNRIASQVIVHRTVWCSTICGFIIRQLHKLHRTAPSLYINIFIFNIKYIFNSLITLVFKKKKNV